MNVLLKKIIKDENVTGINNFKDFLKYNLKHNFFSLTGADLNQIGSHVDSNDIFNIGIIKKSFAEDSFLDAYKKMWSYWNPTSSVFTRSVYQKLGGKKRFWLACPGSFFYSGIVLHVLNPVYIAFMIPGIIVSGHAGSFMVSSLGVTSSYFLFSLPIVVRGFLKRSGFGNKTKTKNDFSNAMMKKNLVKFFAYVSGSMVSGFVGAYKLVVKLFF